MTSVPHVFCNSGLIPHHSVLFRAERFINPQDHDVIVEEKTGNSRFLSISGGLEVVDFLAGYKR